MRKFAVPYLDVMTLLVLVLLLLIFAALMKITDAESAKQIDTTSKFLVEMRWGNASRNDIDVSVKTPNQNVIWFRDLQGDFASLDHDNKGTDTDNRVLDPNGNVITSDRRDEIIYIREAIPGTYVVNVHAYSKYESEPESVTVTLISVSPKYRQVVQRTIVLTLRHEEVTAFRFRVDAAGVITGTDDLPEMFINNLLAGKPI